VLKKTIKYTDFNGEEVEEDCYFNLSKAELTEMELSVDGGMADHLKKIVASNDGKEIITTFKDILLRSYGKRSDDGRRFIKNQQIREEFESSEAYSTIFMDLVTDADSAADFINGIVPAGMVEEAAKIAEQETNPKLVPAPDIPNNEEVEKDSTAI
jgi:hypothetical protein